MIKPVQCPLAGWCAVSPRLHLSSCVCVNVCKYLFHVHYALYLLRTEPSPERQIFILTASDKTEKSIKMSPSRKLETITWFFFQFPNQTKQKASCCLARSIQTTTKVGEGLACEPHATPLRAARLPSLLSSPLRWRGLSMHAKTRLPPPKKMPSR